jgi:hypothetical protein
MSRIIWLNQSNLPDPLQHIVADIIPGFDYAVYKNVMKLCYTTSFFSRTERPGTPFALARDPWHSRLPQPSKFVDFDSITDERCHQLREHQWDRPWLVEWSGGLDSTLVLCALLKNLNKQDLANITVGMTPVSIYENPNFFHNCIKGKLQIKDITAPDYQNLYKTHYLITGEPADMLTGGALAMHACSNGLDLTLPWRDNQSVILDFFAGTSAGSAGAQWLIDTMAHDIENREETYPPVDNILEWFHWINLSWKWTTKQIYKFKPGLHDPKQYFHSLINWFDTDDYQNWSINHGRYSLITDGISLNSYKKDFRRYIMRIFPDHYYAQFKIKVASTSWAMSQMHPWACLLDDGSTLTAQNHLEEIASLIPTVLNSAYHRPKF